MGCIAFGQSGQEAQHKYVIRSRSYVTFPRVTRSRSYVTLPTSHSRSYVTPPRFFPQPNWTHQFSNTDPTQFHPWVLEFWETHFRCDLSYKRRGVARQRDVTSSAPRGACSGDETLRDVTTFAHNAHVTNTINAVYAYAYGLTK